MTLNNWYTSVYFTPSCKEKFITIIINSCFEFQTKIGENSNQKKITWKKRIKRLLILHNNFQFSSPFKIKSLALSNKERWISSTLYTLISLCIIILHILSTFPKMLTRRFCLLIKRFFCWKSFPSFSWL